VLQTLDVPQQLAVGPATNNAAVKAIDTIIKALVLDFICMQRWF